MPNPNQPQYGRLQIDTTDKVQTTASQVQTDKGRDGVGGMQSGGFKFAQDARSAYNTPQSLLDATLEGLPGMMKGVADGLETANKWAADFDSAIEDDRAMELAELQASDTYVGALLDEDRETMVDNLDQKFEGMYVTDKAKDRHTIRRMTQGAKVRIAKGEDLNYAFDQSMASVDNLSPADQIAMLERYEGAADDMLDPRLRAAFDQKKRNAEMKIAKEWADKNTQAVEDFQTWTSTQFGTMSDIKKQGITGRDQFIATTANYYIERFKDASNEQRAIARTMLESLAGDQYDSAAFTTGELMSHESSQVVAFGVHTRDRDAILPVLSGQSAMKGLKVLSQAMSQTTFMNWMDQMAFAQRTASQLFGENPSLMQDFLRGVPPLPEGADPGLVALHTAAQKGATDFEVALADDALHRGASASVEQLYARRVVDGLKGQRTGDGNVTGSDDKLTNQEQQAIAAAAERSGAAANIRAQLGIPNEVEVPKSLIDFHIYQANNAPSSGLILAGGAGYDAHTVPTLMNAVAGLPSGMDKEMGLIALSNADKSVAEWFEHHIEKGDSATLEKGGLLSAYRLYQQGLVAASIGGTSLVPGTLTSVIDSLPENDFTMQLRYKITDGMEGMRRGLINSKYYDDNGVRIMQDHDDAKSFQIAHANDVQPVTVDEAMQSNMVKATGAAFKRVRESGLFKEGQLDKEVLAANSDLLVVAPTVIAALADDPHHLGSRVMVEDLISTIYPDHVVALYTSGSPVMKAQIEGMTSRFFTEVKKPDQSSLGEFVTNFEISLGHMMALSRTPSVRTDGLNRLGAASSVVVRNTLSERDRLSIGDSTVHERLADDDAFDSVNTNADRYAYGEVDNAGNRVKASERNVDYIDRMARSNTLAERYGEKQQGQESDEEFAAKMDQRFADEVDEGMGSALVEYALRSPDFRDILMAELAGDVPPEMAVSQAMIQWQKDKNVVVTLVPATVESSGSSIDNTGWTTTNAQGRYVNNLGSKETTPLRFSITATPADGPIGNRIRFVDGTSEYSNIMAPNSERLYWDGDSESKASAVGTTNGAGRTFLSKQQVHDLNTEFMGVFNEMFPETPADQLADLDSMLTGSPVSSSVVRSSSQLEQAQMGILSLSGDPATEMRQMSVERAISVLSVLSMMRTNDKVQFDSGQSAIQTLKEHLPKHAQGDAVSTKIPRMEADYDEYRADPRSGHEIRSTLFDFTYDFQGRPQLEVQATRLDGKAHRYKLNDKPTMDRIRRLMTTGTDTPVLYYPGETPERDQSIRELELLEAKKRGR